MLIITDLLGNSEVITKFNNFEMNEELNGGFTLSFSSLLHDDNPGHAFIQQEGFIEYEGYEFRVKQLRTTTFTKQVTAISTYFDNADKRKYDIFGGTNTLDAFLSYTLADTGWTFVNENVTHTAYILDFGNDNVVKLIDILKSAFKCEMKIEPNKTLRFSNKLGPDNDFQYRYKHNIMAVSESIDTTKLKTYIEGFGKNGLHVKYTSPMAASPGIGIRHAEPIHDDQFEIAENLLEYMKRELHDYPESTVELDSIELQEKELGESVWLIHERLGIEYQTRVISKRTRIPKTASTVVLGNYKPQTLSGMLSQQKVEIERNKKQTIARFIQTNESFKFDVERLDEGISEARATFGITADEIRSEVSALGEDLASVVISAEAIQSSVSHLDERVGYAETVVTQTAEGLQSRVAKTDFTGETVMTLIDQTAENIRLKAQRIEMEGITHINGNVEIGKGWEPNAQNGAKKIRFSNAGEIVYYDGFEYRSATHGHIFVGDISFASSGDPNYPYEVDFSNVKVKGLTVVASFGE